MKDFQPYLSVLIKALNEEDEINACIQSVLREAEGIDCEIILADSLSTDRTVEIAKQYPIKIVQFINRADRGAGAAAQLAYQYATGQFIYMLDGDMTMQHGFLRQALQVLESEPELAGVGGILQDTRVNNMFDRHRVKKKPSATAGAVKWLNGGGLYRKSAIEQVQYFAHRFLPAYEEAELGMRLRRAGWKLKRLPVLGVSHTGHDESTWGLLRRHWKNGYAKSSGMLIKSGLKRGYALEAMKINKEPLGLLVLVFVASLGFIDIIFLKLALFLWISLFVFLLLKKLNLKDACFSFFHWHFRVFGLVSGLLTKVNDPNLRINSNALK
ncbi:glycosyltransferase [Deefgea rivuli]|uniref:glycosyltransferase n=1 Tax=Deefgea rivuli TaxID=400948 RepID=UPI0004895C8C|nr:glycosyltransferase [Deefgea rivuli]